MNWKGHQHANNADVCKDENAFVKVWVLRFGKENFINQGRQSQINPAQQCRMRMGVQDKFIIKLNWGYKEKTKHYTHQCYN